MVKSKNIMIVLYALIFCVLFYEWNVIRNDSDFLGFTSWELSLFYLIELLSYIVLPLFVVFFTAIDKIKWNLLVIMMRSGTSIMGVAVIALENSEISFNMLAQILVNLIFIVLVIIIYHNNRSIKIFGLAIACRILLVILADYISIITYSIVNGYSDWVITLLYVIASEMLMLLPLLKSGNINIKLLNRTM